MEVFNIVVLLYLISVALVEAVDPITITIGAITAAAALISAGAYVADVHIRAQASSSQGEQVQQIGVDLSEK